MLVTGHAGGNEEGRDAFAGVPVATQRQRDFRPRQDQRGALLRYASMGVELAAAIVGLTLLGLWIDHRFETGPTGLLVGVSLGVVGGFYNFMREAVQLSRRDAVQGRPGETPEKDERDDQP